MKLFTCSACTQVLFFENVVCTKCGHTLAYLQDHAVLSAVEPAPAEDGKPPTLVALATEAKGARYKLCANSTQFETCNWAIPADSPETYCRSCGLNQTIPNMADNHALDAWQRLEKAKRRLVYTLIGLGLPLVPKRVDPRGLAFSFLEETGGAKVLTGHDDGLITINIAEADDPFREKMRVQMGEAYRTVLGHFRHEIGHYYWDRLIADSEHLAKYRELFGDETADYAQALQKHYDNGAPSDWPLRFVSAYASMHPWEDWAETWAHYLHMVDTLETSRSYGLALRPKAVGGGALPEVAARRLHFDDFDDLLSAWVPLTVALNSLNRGMGLPDLYPFVLSEPAIAKLRFVHDVVDAASNART